MPERVAGVGAWNGNHEQPLGLAVRDDDLRVVRVSVPLERDRVASVLACVKFDEHPSRLRLLVRGRARGLPWVLPRGSTPGCTRPVRRALGLLRACTPYDTSRRA